MPPSKNNVNEELSKALVETTALAQTLIGEIQDNASALATLQAKLESLGDSVSSLLSDESAKGSVMTRLAVIEKTLEDTIEELSGHMTHDEEAEKNIYKKLEEVKELFETEKKTEASYTKDKALGFLKLGAVSLPGIIALIIELIK